MMEANLTEIFYSIQGEGLLVGTPFLFVRTGGCNLDCFYCDTDWSRSKQPILKIKKGERIDEIPNPVSVKTFLEILKDFSFHYLTFTGGEPLLEKDFIEASIDGLADKKILIETNGTLPETLSETLLKRVDYWSADIKLPSVAGKGCLEKNHEFLKRLTPAKSVILKAVFSPETPEDEISTAYRISAELFSKNQQTTLIFQPLSEEKNIRLGENHQFILQLAESGDIPVRIIPQIHKILNVL